LYSAGIHPWHIHPDHWEEDVASLKSFIHHPQIIALGEAGLDRLVDLPMNIQRDVFMAMAELSEEAKKPMIIHCVRSHMEIKNLHHIIKPTQPWILHGFNVRLDIAEAMLEEGFYFSFGASILNHKSSAADVLKQLPADRIFLETDECNESIQSIYEQAAKIRSISIDELKIFISINYTKLFKNAG
jgi:TatD DNase family protein